MCGSDKPAVNEFRFGDDISPVSSLSWAKLFANETFHPTPLGHELIAQAIDHQINELMHPSDCEQASFYAGESLEAPGYWDVDAAPASLAKQTIGEFVTAFVTSLTRPIVHIQLFKDSLQPGSQVQIEIHSKPESLGKFTVGDDGSLSQTVRLPSDLTPGIHTIHIYGMSPSGEQIDLYQTINYDPSAAVDKAIPYLASTTLQTPVSSTFLLTDITKRAPRLKQAPPLLAAAAATYDEGVKGMSIIHSGVDEAAALSKNVLGRPVGIIVMVSLGVVALLATRWRSKKERD
jgi:hypothetical protein